MSCQRDVPGLGLAAPRAQRPPPPPPPRPPAPAWRRPLVIGAITAAATVYLAVTNPGAPGNHVFPACPLRFLTGLDCPFCGGLRAVHALAHGDPGAAIGHNLVFVASVPFLVVAWALWMARTLGWRAPRLRRPRWGAPALVVLLSAFMVARNLPFPAVRWMYAGGV